MTDNTQSRTAALCRAGLLATVILVAALGGSAGAATSGPFTLTSDVPDTVEPGDSITVTYTITNTGSTNLSSLGFQTLAVPDGMNVTSATSSKTVVKTVKPQNVTIGLSSIKPGESTTVTLSMNVSTTGACTDALSISTVNGFGTSATTQTQSSTITLLTDLDGDCQGATNVDSDSALEDVNGDGALGIADVNLLFKTYFEGVLSGDGQRYDYDESGSFGLGDVNKLFTEYFAQ